MNLTESSQLPCCRLTHRGVGPLLSDASEDLFFPMQVHRGGQRPLRISSLEGEGGFAPECFTVSLALCYGVLEIAS